MSRLRRLRLSDRIFFVTANLRRDVDPFKEGEYQGSLWPAWMRPESGLAFCFAGMSSCPTTGMG
jgi:hypothetical protein